LKILKIEIEIAKKKAKKQGVSRPASITQTLEIFTHGSLFGLNVPNNYHFGSYKCGVIHVYMYWIPKLMSLQH